MKETLNTVDLQEFKNLGYLVQYPDSEASYYYMVKQIPEGTRQIILKTHKITAEVEVRQNYKKVKLTAKEVDVLEQILVEQFGITQYDLV